MTDRTKAEAANPLVETRRDVAAMASEFAKALPRQMPSEKFVRTVNTAIQLNPDLATADRRTLMAACMKAAQDGLLPDGREGALVIYNTKTKVKENGREVERWVPAVQWMPMVAGLMKKARNSGEIAGISASVVFRHDHFKLVKGDEERFEHEPNLDVDDSELTEANARGAYCIISLKDGTKIRSWRNKAQIQLARSVSKAGNSLMWTKFWEEGYCKVAIRHACKFAPSSADKEGTDAFMRAAERDDETYDFSKGARDITPSVGPVVGDGTSKLDRFMAARQGVQDAQAGAEHDPETGEIDEEAEKAPAEAPRPAQATETQPKAASASGEAPAANGGPSGDLLGETKPAPKPATNGDTVLLSLPGLGQPQRMPFHAAVNSLTNSARECELEAGALWIERAIKANPWAAVHKATREVLEHLLEQCRTPADEQQGLDP